MLRQRQEQVQLVVKVGDFVLTAFAFFLAFQFRSLDWMVERFGMPMSLDYFYWMLGAAWVLQLLLYPTLGLYQSLRRQTLVQLLIRSVKLMGLQIAILGALVFFFQAKETSRYFFVLFVLFQGMFVFLERALARSILKSLRVRGYNFRRIFFLGDELSVREIESTLQEHPDWGYVVVGRLDLEASRGLSERLKTETVDEVWLASRLLHAPDLKDTFEVCETWGIPVQLFLGMFKPTGFQFEAAQLGHIPTLQIFRSLRSPWQAFVKRGMDLLVASGGLLLTAILYPWISYRIQKESPGPVVFKQWRVGENGRRFKCYKFRSMKLNAEAELDRLRSLNQVSGPMFKLEEDPRVFPFGRFLRRTSLDELPQFLNVIRGEMSVVGTRPPTPDEVEKYPESAYRRLSIRPGITGLWQVSGRSEIREFRQVLALDLQYIDRWSLWLDLRILFQTVWVVLVGRGAK